MLDFELRKLNEIRKPFEARKLLLHIWWDRTVRVSPFGFPSPVCLPGYAGHVVNVSDNELSTAVYIDHSYSLTGEKVLDTDELRELTYAVDNWNIHDDHVNWSADELYCYYRLSPGSKTSYAWPNDVASVPAGVANLVAILRRLTAMVQPVSTD
jgi:hypothetical protein